MIDRLKPYPSYKDSGVVWLGKVPEHWKVRRLRNAAEMRVSNVDKHTKDGEEPVRLCNYVDVYKNDRVRSGMSFMRATATSDEIERFRLQTGDVLITKDSEAWNDIGVPALVEETADDLISGYHIALLRPFTDRVDSEYLLRTLQSNCVAFQFHVEANGVTRYGLSHRAIKSICLPLPPLPEQTAIARFLGYMDRRIQRLIRAKQRLIKLLEEQKHAIIHEAVKGRIDVRIGKPYPSYKDSGVEWLGMVPEGWEIWPIMRIGKLFKGNGGSKEDEVPEGIPCVRYGDLYTRYEFFIRSAKACVSTSTASAYTRIFPGDVLFAASGETFEDIGRSAVNLLKGIACCGGDILLLRPSVPMNLQFLGYATDAPPSRHQKATMGRGFTVVHIYASQLKQLMLALPPLPEQTAIVQYLDSHLASLSSSMESSRRAIDLLKEYRTRLISDVVTGKVDVREAAALLPDEDEAGGAEALSDEFEELEPLDEEGFEPEGGDEE